jgi:hypothetical protein
LSDKYFKSYKDTKDLKAYADSITDEVADKRNDIKRYQLMYKNDLEENIAIAKNGNWLFDPKKIDPKFKK